MGPVMSFITSTDLQRVSVKHGAGGRRHKKAGRVVARVQKSEDVPAYKGSWPVEKLVDYIDNSPLTSATERDSLERALSPVATLERREGSRQNKRRIAESSAVPKADPTETDSGCGDSITTDQKDLINSLEITIETTDENIPSVTRLNCLDEIGDECLSLTEKNPVLFSTNKLSHLKPLPLKDSEFITVQRKRKVKSLSRSRRATRRGKDQMDQANCEADNGALNYICISQEVLEKKEKVSAIH